MEGCEKHLRDAQVGTQSHGGPSTSLTLLTQWHGSPGDLERLPSTTINNLSEDLLLEIFHSHRQSFERLSRDYESSWNSREGWFTLAHVCQKWRFIVFTSCSRLHVRLVFMSRRPLRAVMLTYLPPLPIVVDYSRPGVWTLLEGNRAVAALKSYPDRVRRIAISGWNYNLEGVCKATNCSFPALESFDLLAAGNPGIGAYPARFTFPARMLLGSAASLRRLELKNVIFKSLSQLLSSTTGLVDLTLHIDTICRSSLVSLLAHLQGMPCLRSLEVQTLSHCSHTAGSLNSSTSGSRETSTSASREASTSASRETSTQRGDIVSMSRWCFEPLAASLSAPFLQDLNIHLKKDSSVEPLPHLSRFIRDVEEQFFAAQVKLAPEDFEISVLTHSHSIDEPRRRISIRDIGRWKVQTGTALNAKLTTVEELFLESPYPDLEGGPRWLSQCPIPWGGFLGQFHNVKILRVERGLVLDVAHFLSQVSALDLLPALEEIELRSSVSRYVDDAEPISDIQREAVDGTLRPFVTAREQTGRPVKISWNSDIALPRPYM
ncbi:hypothetical protein BJV78DRAFT_1156041 [Lactifluus subvellereus]|nr:hypothetical protein BJV78DRAFT_1156041 [Lactifluus subvellereus]